MQDYVARDNHEREAACEQPDTRTAIQRAGDELAYARRMRAEALRNYDNAKEKLQNAVDATMPTIRERFNLAYTGGTTQEMWYAFATGCLICEGLPFDERVEIPTYANSDE